MPITLYPHNQAAFDAVVQLLERTGRAAVIHPTGTGKSFIAFKMLETYPNWRFLWLSPSNYIFEAQCSALKQSDLELNLDNVCFMTYARLMLLSESKLEDLFPDCIILDEFHRCGAQAWSLGVQALLRAFPEAKLLGLTATNVRYLDNGRDMAEELFCQYSENCIASRMSLGEAIVRGILPTPRYITTLYGRQKLIEQYRARIARCPDTTWKTTSLIQLEALRQAVEHAPNLDEVFKKNLPNPRGKYILFCTDWEHMQQIEKKIPQWFGELDSQPQIYFLYSGRPETDANFQQFQRDQSNHLRLLLCINRLNEGVHLTDLSGVVLFRMTSSPILYKQQIGRALTVGRFKTPVIFDIVNNFENLASIGTIRSEMHEAARSLRKQRRESEIVTQDLVIEEQVENSVALFRKLEQTLQNTWESFYGEAADYYHKCGNLLVPRRYVTENGVQLGIWIATQKAVHADSRKGTLTPEQIYRLEAIGMVWENRLEVQWTLGLQHAWSYFNKYANLLVAYGYQSEDGFPLGRWISYLRSRKKIGALPLERVEQLETIGMVWDAYTAKWELGFEHARAYYRRYGDLKVPAAYKSPDGFALGSWIVGQRKLKSPTKSCVPLTQEQIDRLDSIGFQWEKAFETQWNTGFLAAKEYFTQNGNLNIPYSYCTADGFCLGRWVRRQRSARKNPGKQTNTIITPERQRQLEEIGMIW